MADNASTASSSAGASDARWLGQSLIGLTLLRAAGLVFTLVYLLTHLAAVRRIMIVHDNHRAETAQQITIANVAVTLDTVIAVAIIVGYVLIARGLANRQQWAPKTLLVVSAVQILIAAIPRANPYPTSVQILAFVGALLCIATFLLLMIPTAGRELILPATRATPAMDSVGGERKQTYPGLIPKWATYPLTFIVILVIVPAQDHASVWGHVLIWVLLLGFLALGVWYRRQLKRQHDRTPNDSDN